LIIQVEDGGKAQVSKTDLDAVVRAVRDEAGELPQWAFGHAFDSQSGHLYQGWSQVISATVRENTSAGVLHPNVCRGRFASLCRC